MRRSSTSTLPGLQKQLRGHREARPRPSDAVRAMVGMKCDGCERLLQYKSEVVAVYRVGGSGSLQARLVTEDTPGSGEAASQATAKHHRDCYCEARNRDPSLPQSANPQRLPHRHKGGTLRATMPLPRKNPAVAGFPSYGGGRIEPATFGL